MNETIRKGLRLTLVALAFAPGAMRAGGTTWTVDILADENDGPCVAGDCSLREAILGASDGDQIQFALPGSAPWTIAIVPAAGQIAIDHDLSIVGPGVADLTISGADARRIFSVEAAATVVVSGLRLFDGRAHLLGDKHGGCVRVLGQATFTDVRFESCNAWDGGVTSNIEGGDGGAVYVAAGATFTATGVAFVDNRAGKGGGASGIGSGFTGGRGGALVNLGTATLVACTVTGSRSGDGGGPGGWGGGGGGLANLGSGVLRVDDSTISDNRTGDGNVFMATVGLDGRGGGVLCASTCTFNQVTISNNAIGVVAGVGNANVGGGLAVAAGTTRLRNVTVAGNVASGNGGGIARDGGGTIRPRSSLFSGNDGAGNFDDCNTNSAAGIVTEGFNLIRVNDGCATSFSGTDLEGTSAAPLDPLLGALAANGGPTMTRALGTGSPAIEHGDSAGCKGWDGAADFTLAFDQRGTGFPRATDGDGDTVARCDVGAFETPAVAPVEHDLVVTLAGPALAGTVTSDPAGIDCPGTCSASFVLTETVDLTASPASGFAFSGWSGACTGTGGCSVVMSADRAVTATFVPLRTLAVFVAGDGAGSVASTPPGIACPVDCDESLPEGTGVSLAATPAGGSFFTGWSGDCSGTAGCALTLSVNRSVTATFDAARTLTVSLAGGGAGTVTSSPTGIDCPGDCSEGWPVATPVTLTATPSPGSFFGGWSGDCTGGSCALVMSVDRAATATFVSNDLFADGFESGAVCVWSSAVGAPVCPPLSPGAAAGTR